MTKTEYLVIDLRTRTYLASALATFALVTASVPAAADSIQILSIQTGHSIILAAPGLTRVAVGDGRIAGVVPIGTSQIVVNGKAPGHTTIFVWMDGERATYEVTVTEQSFDDIAKVLRAAINEPTVQVVAFNVNLIVRGTVADVAAYNRINDVIDRFKGIKFTEAGSSAGNGVIINAVTIAKPLGNLQDEIAALPGGHGLRVDADSKGNVVVSGTVRDQSEVQQVLDKVNGLAGPYLAADGKVINRLGVDQTSQVDVKVYVLEVDHTAQSQLGLRLQSGVPSSITGQGANPPYTLSSQPSFTAIDNPTSNPFNLGAFARISLLAPTLDLLLEEGHARVLSSPNLVTQPGTEATFLVGGEIPIPISNGLGTVSVSYKEYGVKLDVTPTILGNGSVEEKINPEISSLDFADGIQISGFTIPALKVSQLTTDVITQNGESIIMGGLLQRQEQKNVTKFPILGDIPVLGQLFRSVSYQNNQTDVVFVVTPTIVTK